MQVRSNASSLPLLRGDNLGTERRVQGFGHVTIVQFIGRIAIGQAERTFKLTYFLLQRLVRRKDGLKLTANIRNVRHGQQRVLT